MKKAVASIITILVLQFVGAQSLITVKQDGSGNFQNIQQAIDASMDGDTILVWPGIYYEHLYAFEKNFVLGSLTLTTGDPSYISQTIIDGMNTDRCIEIYYSSLGTIVWGFTIKNGAALGENSSSGGGCYVWMSDVEIIDCIVECNLAKTAGGGIYSVHSNTFFSGTTFRYNHSFHSGGGICRGTGTIQFDSINLCNIYLNYAAKGTDISAGDGLLHVYTDTFTVLEPDYYYMYSDSGGWAVNDISWNINAGKIDQTDQNLFVSPDGNNSNSGLSPDEALKDISFALLKMKSDTITPDTIHIANGYYAPSTGEKFPLSLKAEVSLIGEFRDSVILDGEDSIYIMHGIYNANNFSIKNMIIQHGNGDKYSVYGRGAFSFFENKNVTIENIVFRENKGRMNSSGRIANSNGIKVLNSAFENNIGGETFRTTHAKPELQSDTIKINQCKFINNIPDYSIPSPEGAGGGGVSINGYEYLPINDLFVVTYSNCLFTNNHTRIHPYGGMSQISMVYSRNSKGFVSNCTFGDNSSDNTMGANIGITYNSEVSIYNSVLYNNNPAELYMYTYEGNSYLNIYNSCVQEGLLGIKSYTAGNIIDYAPSNIDTDPMWDTTNFYPYSLSAGSPCIDAGTLDLPPGIELPETDLAGNPRIYNGYVDMGAYEYGPWVGIQQPAASSQQPAANLLKIWPNPFRFETTISYERPESGQCIIRIYDLNGRCVKTLMNSQGLSGNGEMKWRGIDDSGNPVPAGTYIVAIILNGKEWEAVKVVRR